MHWLNYQTRSTRPERTLKEINKAEWEIAHRLFQFVAVAVRPLRVEELAELLAFDIKAGSIPKFHEDWRLEDPIHAVLSTCRSFLAIVDDDIYPLKREVVQFSHFSVKEFLTSARLAKAKDIILRRYHISETPAQTLAARVCLGYLLHLDMDVTSDSLRNLPFAKYSAEYLVHHVRLEDVSQNVKDGLKELFDPSKPHLAVCIWIYDPSRPLWERMFQSTSRPSPLRGTPLHYAAIWDLHSIVELLINDQSQNVNSQDFIDSETPLHVASNRGHLEVARILIERGAGVSTQNKDGKTPLHMASFGEKRDILFDTSACHPEVARMLIERGVDVSAQDKDGQTPLHLASKVEGPEVARMLIERGAGVSTQDKDGQTPLHLASQAGRPKVTRMLIEHGAGVSAQDKDGQTPLHLASKAAQLDAAGMLIERGASVSAQNKDGQTPLHLVSLGFWYPYIDHGRPVVVRMLIGRGADVSAQDKVGRTPIHLASRTGQPRVIRMLIERGADVSAQDKDCRTPIHLASQARQQAVIRMLLVHGADASAQN